MYYLYCRRLAPRLVRVSVRYKYKGRGMSAHNQSRMMLPHTAVSSSGKAVTDIPSIPSVAHSLAYSLLPRAPSSHGPPPPLAPPPRTVDGEA